MNSLALQIVIVTIWYSLVAAVYYFAGEQNALIVFWVGTAVQVCLAINTFVNPPVKKWRNKTWYNNPISKIVGFAIIIFALNQYFHWLGWSAELVERLTGLMIGKEILFWIRDRLK